MNKTKASGLILYSIGLALMDWCKTINMSEQEVSNLCKRPTFGSMPNSGILTVFLRKELFWLLQQLNVHCWNTGRSNVWTFKNNLQNSAVVHFLKRLSQYIVVWGLSQTLLCLFYNLVILYFSVQRCLFLEQMCPCKSATTLSFHILHIYFWLIHLYLITFHNKNSTFSETVVSCRSSHGYPQKDANLLQKAGLLTLKESAGSCIPVAVNR